MVSPIDILRRIFGPGRQPPQPSPPPIVMPDPVQEKPVREEMVRRHFFNERGFQTYASFFKAWDGWITAGHVLDESKDRLPPFANGRVEKWPAGLDAALLGCTLPQDAPTEPIRGQTIRCIGFPAGSTQAAQREAKVYMQRPGQTDTWIAHILNPDEPVVTGMSGGAVIDVTSGHAIGIIITRNSPADLNNDRDPDESLDFVSLAGVWRALNGSAFV
jgi:hypothetical protein